MPQENRASDALVQERVDDVVDLLLDGYTRKEVLQFISNAGWEISDRQVDNYIAKANDAIHEVREIDRAKRIARVERRIERLYRKALKQGNLALARQLVGDERTLSGLDAPSKTALTDDDGKALGVLVLPQVDLSKVANNE